MYKDIIKYELADGISKDHLLKVAGEIIKSWMGNLEGFLGWDIHEDGEGHFTDIVYWRSKDDAINAEKDMQSIPNAADWYMCYKPGSIKGEKLHCLASFGGKG